MPKFVNPEMKKLRPEGGRNITFFKDNKLQEWLTNIPNILYPNKPSTATNKECYSLMVLLWYTGARPTELCSFKKDHIFPLSDGTNIYGFSVSLITKKRRIKFYRKITIPYNNITLKAYHFIQDSSPEGYYLHSFRGSTGINTYNTKWINKRIIYVRDKTGALIPEVLVEHKSKTYECYNKLIRTFTNALTGLPPLYFRHHRFSWMSRLGATPNLIKEFKGAADIRSVEEYIQFSEQQAKENLKYFPTNGA